jgi:hypothetical protein
MAGGDVIDCTLRGAGLWSILLTLGDLINSVQRRLLAHSLSSQRKPAQRGLSSGLSHGLDAALGGCTAPWMLVRIWSLENGETASRDEKTRPGGEAPRRVQSLRVGFQARATHVNERQRGNPTTGLAGCNMAPARRAKAGAPELIYKDRFRPALVAGKSEFPAKGNVVPDPVINISHKIREVLLSYKTLPDYFIPVKVDRLD